MSSDSNIANCNRSHKNKLSAYLSHKQIEIMLIKLVFRLKVDYLVYYLGRYIPVSSEGFHLRFS